MLMACEVAKLLNAGLHIVTRHTLALHDGGDVDVVLYLLVSLNDTLGYRNAEIALAFENRDPVIAFEADFTLRGPEVAHGGGGVAFSEDVGDRIRHGCDVLGYSSTNRKQDGVRPQIQIGKNYCRCHQV